MIPLVIALFLGHLICSSWGQTYETCLAKIDKYDRSVIYTRKFVAFTSNTWPTHDIPYKISPDFSLSDVQGIREAMHHIENGSCIRFVEFKEGEAFLDILTGRRGCYTSLGYNYLRKGSPIHLERHSYCMRIGSIAHEILHALGFIHEHTRPDRDDYISINWEHVPKYIINNWVRCAGMNETPSPRTCDMDNPREDFDTCYSGFKVQTYGVGYDYGSVMHYGLTSGTRKGHQLMTPKKAVPEGVSIGQRKGLSKMDFEKLNRAYRCN